MTIRWSTPLRASVLAGVALAFACTERPDPAAPELAPKFWGGGSATHATSYSGRATVVQATVLGVSAKLGGRCWTRACPGC